MDLHLAPTPTTTPDDAQIHAPQHTRTQPINPLSFKNHQPPRPLVVAYKECMKNHAANLGGHAVDGCGEYMPSGSAVPTDPTSLKCAACGCHRNFHRSGLDYPTAITPPFLDFRHPPQPRMYSAPSPPSPPPQPFSYAPHMLLALSTAVAEAEEPQQEPATPTAENAVGRKRVRTKFSQEQKEKMHSFSEKLGWKMRKSYEAQVEEFCHEVGITKGVLKVWMHNNKNTLGKKEIINGELISLDQNNDNANSSSKNEEIRKIDNGGHFQNENGGGVHFLGSNNGTSCSSP